MEDARGYVPRGTRTAQIIDSSAPAIPQVTGMLELMTSPASAPVHGSDRFGKYSKIVLGWQATSSNGAVTSFTTSFRTYADGRTLVLEQGIPKGATHTNHKNVTFADGKYGELATTEPYPFLQFPTFNVSHAQSIFANPGQSGFITWKGTFVGLHGPFPGAPSSADLGLSGGPVVVFDGSSSSVSSMFSVSSMSSVSSVSSSFFKCSVGSGLLG